MLKRKDMEDEKIKITVINGQVYTGSNIVSVNNMYCDGRMESSTTEKKREARRRGREEEKALEGKKARVRGYFEKCGEKEIWRGEAE